jgi:hypothetical protein
MRQRYPAAALGVDAAREVPWVEHLGDGGGRSHADDDGPYAETASTAWMSVAVSIYPSIRITEAASRDQAIFSPTREFVRVTV